MSLSPIPAPDGTLQRHDRPLRIGIDLGGTKIEVVALAPDGTIVARQRVPTPRDYDGTIRTLVDLIGGIEQTLDGRATVGMGIPGVVVPATGLVKNANSTWLNGRPFQQDLAEALGRPVRMANDANCFTLSEAADGAAAGEPVVFGVIVGTGCGGGLVVDGKIVEGANGIAGEWGHTPLPWSEGDEHPGPACWCGRRGCMETFVSGKAFEADFARVTGRTQGSRAIVEQARAGEPAATAALDRYVARLARGLAMICDIVDPDVIVLGGGMSNVGELYERLPAAIAAHAFTDSFVTRVVQARHGDSSGVRGAAWLWPGA